jgi:phosphoserine phosphatase RsbU/P
MYRIVNGSVLGRGEVDVALNDPKVSRIHAKFTVEGNQFVLWDFGSRNGTLVNGSRLRAATQLDENDEILVGDTALVLKVLE